MSDNDDPLESPTFQLFSSPFIRFSRLLLGVGNALHGDDGAGPILAQSFQTPGWLSLDTGAAPENFTSIVRRHHPDLLVIVDAADLRLAPGEFRRVPRDRIQNVGLGTHQMPMYHLIDFLADTADRIEFIGIQPGQLAEEPGLSPEVKQAVHRLSGLLRDGEMDRIPVFQ